MFKLTPATDPATVMFEGHPDVKIDRITKGYESDLVYVRIGEHPVGTKFGDTFVTSGNNHAHDPNGIDVSGRRGNVWPRIVPRFRLDPSKPLDVRFVSERPPIKLDMVRERNYTIKARILPIGKDTPEIYIIGDPTTDHFDLKVDPMTGRVTEGHQGSNLQFFHPPEPVVELFSFYSPQTGKNIAAAFTSIDGVPTNIELR